MIIENVDDAMKIVHFTLSFSPPSETFIYEYICEMQRQGIQTDVLTLWQRNSDERPFQELFVVPPPPVWHPLRIRKMIEVIFHLKDPLEEDFSFYRPEIHKIVARLRPDAIHAHFGPAGVLIAPIAKIMHIPLVVTFQGYDITQLLRMPLWRARYRSLFQTGSHFFAVSRALYERVIEAGAAASLVSILHNGIDLKKFEFSDPLNRFDGKNVQLLYVGRFVPKEDPLRLIRAFLLCKTKLSEDKRITLTMIGDGPLRSDAQDLLRQLNLEGEVHILGEIPHDQIPLWLRRSHLYTQHCVTAEDGDQEGLPVAITEAAATGLPIISTRHSGIPEADVEGMAEKILELCHKPALWSQFGKAGRQHVGKNFSLQEQVQKSISIFGKILS